MYETSTAAQGPTCGPLLHLKKKKSLKKLNMTIRWLWFVMSYMKIVTSENVDADLKQCKA